MPFYKVTDLRMRSVYYDCYHEKGVQYRLGEFVYPQVGPVFCYSNSHLCIDGFIEYNICLRKHLGDRRIFECECEEPEETKVDVWAPDTLVPKEVGMRLGTGYSPYPRSVVLAKGIKLIKELTPTDVANLVSERRM